MSKSDILWKEIENLKISMFSLANQKISMHVERLVSSEDEVFVRIKSPAVLPALEAALGAQRIIRKEKRHNIRNTKLEVVDVSYPKYDLTENEGGYLVIKRHVLPPEPVTSQKDVGEFFISGMNSDVETPKKSTKSANTKKQKVRRTRAKKREK